MHKIFIILCVCLLGFTGCASTRAIKSARATIEQLEQLNVEGTERNRELEMLIESERTGNKELKRIIDNQQSELDGYFESEKRRIESERKLIDSLSGIFKEGSDIVEQLIKGYNIIREYFEEKEYIR